MTLCKQDVETIADTACNLDYLKNKLDDQERADQLAACAATLHGIACRLDRQHRFGVYATDDEGSAS